MKKTLSLAIFSLLTAGPCGGGSPDPAPDYGSTAVGSQAVTIRVQAESWAFGSVGLSIGEAWISLQVWPGRGPESMHDALAQGGFLRFDEVTGASADAFGTEWLFVGDASRIQLDVSGVGVYAEVER